VLEWLPAFGIILITWCVIISALIGVGLLCIRKFLPGRISFQHLLAAFWAGFSVALGLCQIWHLMWPATAWIWLVIFLLGAMGFFLCRRQILQWLIALKHDPITAAVASVCLLIISVRISILATHAVMLSDTGLYHFPAMQWNHAYAIVPGLANLHSRFGFNSSLFAYAASLSDGIWSARPHHITNGPLFVMIFGISIFSLARIVRRRSMSCADVFGALLALPVVYFVNRFRYPSSLGPNIVVLLMVFAGTWLAIISMRRKANRPGDSRCAFLCTILVLSAAVTVKLTIAPIAFAMWLLMMYWIFFHAENFALSSRARFLGLTISISSLLIVPWLVRGVILSGYPLYPSRVFGVNVSWRAPEIQAEIDYEWTQNYSRGIYNPIVSGGEWIESWIDAVLKEHSFSIVLPVLLSVFSLIVILLCTLVVNRNNRVKIETRYFWLIGIVLVAIITWFLTAPDTRIGVGYCLLLLCVTWSVVATFMSQRSPGWIRTLVILIVGLFLASEMLSLPSTKPFNNLDRLDIAGSSKLSRILNAGVAPMPKIEMRKFITDSGLVLSVPIRWNFVWDAPLLSTPHPTAGLRLRDGDDISAGFEQSGRWLPYGYPQYESSYNIYVNRKLKKFYSFP